jgi:hypothetical protein
MNHTGIFARGVGTRQLRAAMVRSGAMLSLPSPAILSTPLALPNEANRGLAV